MFFNPLLDDATRFLVLFLDAKFSNTRISGILNRDLRTIQDWASKIRNRKDIRKIEQGRSRKPKVTAADKKKVIRQVKSRPSKGTTRKLASRNGVSHTKIHEILEEKGFTYKGVSNLPILNEDQKEERIDYCDEMLENDGEKIFETFFSDEMGIKLSDMHVRRAWGQPNKKLKIEKPLNDIKFNCWGAISANGATSLHIFGENLNAARYQDILDAHVSEMEELYPDGFNFQHDNHPAHRASEGWIEDVGLEQVQFPPYSPDLNPIENLWSALKESVACDNPRSGSGMKASLRANWEKLTTRENLAPYFENLCTRYDECMEEEGERLHY